jgi:cobalt-zinc-cadmium efflux system membrane fusion protein
VFARSTHDHGPSSDLTHERLYELEELKVMLGEMVPAGAPLCILADHHHLQIEGRVFASEAVLLQGAARKGTVLRAVFAGEADKGWPATDLELKITTVANRIDPAQQTLSFFLPLANQFQEYQRNGKVYRLWRFRPGQRVNLKVPVEAFAGVLVLPADAVVHEGADAFVFRADGEFFEKKPVHVIHEDRAVAVVANDGSIAAGLDSLALNAAAQINWTFKAQAPAAAGHDH